MAATMPSMSSRVLVCGATGYLGRHVLRVAHEAGHHVRALARDEARLGEERDFCDEVFVGHATDPSTLIGLCDDIDVVFSSVGNRTLRRKPTIWEVDEGANRNIMAVARETGVAHIVFVSVLAGDRMRELVPQFEARERIVDELRRGEIPTTIIRPSGFFNDMSEMFEMARKGRVWVPGSGEQKLNPVHGADLAEVCVKQFGNPGAYGTEIPVGGPDIVTFRRIAEMCFEAVGKPPRVSSIPLWLLRATGRAVTPFNINVASLVLMFTAFAETDSVTDTYGTHHLSDFFTELADRSPCASDSTQR